MKHSFNYISLLLILIVGVAIGNLVSNYILTIFYQDEYETKAQNASNALTTTPEKPEKHEIIQETVKLSPKTQPNSQTQSKITVNPSDHNQLIEQRKIDENGLRLAKTCNEWTVVHKDMQTQTSEKGMNKHCAEYYDYLSFGNLPNSN